jgi:hypothetical protein
MEMNSPPMALHTVMLQGWWTGPMGVSEKSVRLAQKMQIGPCIPVGHSTAIKG